MSALRRLWPILLPALAMVLIFPWLPQMRSPNELCRLRQTQALVDDGVLEINQALKRHGWAGDLSCVAVWRGGDGRIVERMRCPEAASSTDPRTRRLFRERIYYPSKAPLTSVLAVPVYGALKALGEPVSESLLVYFSRLFCLVLPSVLILVPLRRFLRRKLLEFASSLDAANWKAGTPSDEPPGGRPTDLLADALTATFALGTLAFSYSELFMSHALTGVLALATFFCLEKAGRAADAFGRWMLLSGFCAGLTVACEYTGALPLVPLAVYGLASIQGGWRAKAKGACLGVLGVLPAALWVAAYHVHCFGHPFVSPYLFLNDAGYQGWHVGGFLGIRLPDARAFALSFFSPLRGLFALSPALLLALPGIALGLRRLRGMKSEGSMKRELWLSAGLFALYTYFTSSFTYDSWGWTTGPRHLTPLAGFLTLPLGACLVALLKHPSTGAGFKAAIAGAFAALASLSILATGAMTLVNYVPDTLVESLHGFALPLLFQGFLPHSPLSLAGVPNPFAALPGILAILTAAAIVPLCLVKASWRMGACDASGESASLGEIPSSDGERTASDASAGSTATGQEPPGKAAFPDGAAKLRASRRFIFQALAAMAATALAFGLLHQAPLWTMKASAAAKHWKTVEFVKDSFDPRPGEPSRIP